MSILNDQIAHMGDENKEAHEWRGKSDQHWNWEAIITVCVCL